MHLFLQNVYCWAVKNVRFNLLLLIYILINTAKNYNYSFAVKLDRCIGSCNALNDLSNDNNIYKSKLQPDYWNKWIKNINKVYIMWT